MKKLVASNKISVLIMLTLVMSILSFAGSAHSATTVPGKAGTVSIEKVIDQLLKAECIDPGIAIALIGELTAAQVAINAGDIKLAVGILEAILKEVQAEGGKQIRSSCTIDGTTFDPANTLIEDVTALINALTFTFSIVRTSNPPDAITGHAYSAYISTSLPSTAVPSDVVTSCSLTGNVPSGMTAAPGTPSSGAADYCVLSMSSAPTPGQYNFTLQATDNSSPAKTASHSYALTIRPDFTFTTTSLAQGVQGRTYGVAPLSQPEATNIGTTQGGLTVGNAPLTACALVSVTPSNPGLTVALGPTNTQCLLGSSGLTGAGTFAVTVSATETQITDPVTGVLAVPGASAVPVTSTLPLVANPPITLAVNLGSSWPNAVTGRPYGSGTGCTGGACTSAVYTASGGLGGYVFPANTPASMPAGMVCPAVSGSATYTCSAPAPGISGAAGTYRPSVTVTDAGNTATPPATAASDPLSASTDTLMVAAPLALSADSASVDPPPPGVQNRTYGNTLAGFRELLYDASGGIPAYVFTLPASIAGPGTGVPSPTTCASSATQAFCTSGTNPVTAAPGTYSFNIALDDAGNASTPKGSLSSTAYSFPTPKTIVINSPLTLTVDAASAPVNPAPLGVVGRSYGNTAAGFKDLAFDASNGLAPYVFGLPPAVATPVANGVPAGMACTPSGAALACATGAATISASVAAYPFSITLNDTANATTPSASTSGTQPPAIPGSITINPALTLADNHSGSFPDAVVHRHYGVVTDLLCAPGGTSACTSLIYTATGGLPNASGAYTFPASTPVSFPAGFLCSANTPATMYTCSASPIALSVTPGPFSPSVTVTDFANAAAPSGSQSDTGTLHVDPQIALIVNLGATWPDGVAGRGYGTGGLIAATYTASNGLSNGYTFTPTGSNPASFPTGFNCSPSSPTLTCTASPISGSAGPYTPQVTVTDTATSTTPAGTTTSDPCSILPSATCSPATRVSFTVDPEIAISNAYLPSPTPLPNGELGQPYSVLFTCQAPLVTGTCGGTGNPDNAAAQYTWTASSNNISGVSFTTQMPVPNPTGDAIFSGTPSAIGSNETVTVTITDNGNSTTPSCAEAGTCPPPALSTFSANILPSRAYVGSNSNDAVDVFNTSVGVTGVALVGTGPTIPSTDLTSGVTPNYVAASTNGTDMFVADPGANQLYIIETPSPTITKIVTNTQGLDNLGGDTAAVAVGPQAIPTLGISPDDVYAYVANAGTDNVQIVDANLTSGTFGTVTGTITFKGGPYTGAGATDLKVAPTFFVGGVRKTHAYVVREGGDEVCVFDAEPSSGNFKSQITPTTHNADNCIALSSASGVVPTFIDVSPDGLYAFVTETDGVSKGALKIIGTNPNSGTFETLLATFDLTTLGTSCFGPAGVRTSPDGQTVWVACSDSSHQLVGFETAAVNGAQFTAVPAILTPTNTDFPNGIAFRPDFANGATSGGFGLATLSGANAILPFTTPVPPWNSATAYVPGNEVTYTDGNYYLCLVGNTNVIPPSNPADWQLVGGERATTGVTTPTGIDHIPNPVLHIATTTLPAATHGEPYASSIVANGPNKYFTFADVTTGPNTLTSLGFTLSSDGQVKSTTNTSIVDTPGTYNLTIQVTDQSRPVNNVVVKTVSLTIN